MANINLWDAPFLTPLKIRSLDALSEEARLVLAQLGFDQDETIQKMHKAPLGDPASILIGDQQFTLRAQICRKIQVEVID